MKFHLLIWPCLNVRPTPWFEENIVKRGETVRLVWIDASKFVRMVFIDDGVDQIHSKLQERDDPVKITHWSSTHSRTYKGNLSSLRFLGSVGRASVASLWFISGFPEYHRRFITNTCLPKQSKELSTLKLLPILPRVRGAKVSLQFTFSLRLRS